MFILVLGLLIILLIILSLFIRIYTKIYYCHQMDKDLFRLELIMLGITVFRKEFTFNEESKNDQSNVMKNAVKNKPKQDDNGNHSENLVEKIKVYYQSFKYIISARRTLIKIISLIKIHQFHWDTKLGTGDASFTGILCGSLWGIKGSMVTFMNNYMRVKNRPIIEIHPLFQQGYIYTKLECMVSISIGQTIYAFFRILRYRKNVQVSSIKSTMQT